MGIQCNLHSVKQHELKSFGRHLTLGKLSIQKQYWDLGKCTKRHSGLTLETGLVLNMFYVNYLNLDESVTQVI